MSTANDRPSPSASATERGLERGTELTLRGRVVSGKREAASFTEVPWVREGIRELLGAAPHPGTLNLRPADPASWAAWRRVVRTQRGLYLEPQESGYCAARVFPVVVSRGKAAWEAGARATANPAAIILPLVPGYPEDLIELVAGERLREGLALGDDDEVMVTIVADSE